MLQYFNYSFPGLIETWDPQVLQRAGKATDILKLLNFV